MEPIQIINEEYNGNNWTVFVQVGEDADTEVSTNHSVQVDEDTYDRLTGGMISAGELVEETFRFLLEREPKSSIMINFDLDTVSSYFPDFEEEIQKRI